MPTVITEIRKGEKYSIWGIGNGNTCYVLQFLIDLKNKDLDAFDKINALLTTCIDHGPPKNNEKCKLLTDSKQIYELKTGDGVRILWFWDNNNIMICSHGLEKKRRDTPPGHIKTAEKRKKIYQSAKKNGTLVKQSRTKKKRVKNGKNN